MKKLNQHQTQQGFSLGMPNFSEFERKIQEDTSPKGFELDATYSGSGDEIISCLIRKGYVLIGHKIYTTSLFAFTENTVSIYLCAKKTKTNLEQKKATWKVFLQKDTGKITLKDNEYGYDGFSFLLLRIEDGYLVEDNRYLICLSNRTRLIPGKTIYTPAPYMSSDYTSGSCGCPSMAMRLDKLINRLNVLNAQADAIIKQLPKET